MKALLATRGLRRAGGLFAAVAVTLGVLALGGGAYGAWNTSASDSQSVTAGTLNLASTDTLNTAFGAFAPGDSGYRYVNLQNSGTLTYASLTVQANPGTITGGSGTQAQFGSAFTVRIERCTGTLTVATGVCTGGTGWDTSTPVLANTTLTTLMGSAQSLTAAAIPAPGATVGVRVYYTVDPNAVSSLQGSSLPLSWSFSAAQRASSSTL